MHNHQIMLSLFSLCWVILIFRWIKILSTMRLSSDLHCFYETFVGKTNIILDKICKTLSMNMRNVILSLRWCAQIYGAKFSCRPFLLGSWFYELFSTLVRKFGRTKTISIVPFFRFSNKSIFVLDDSKPLCTAEWISDMMTKLNIGNIFGL